MRLIDADTLKDGFTQLMIQMAMDVETAPFTPIIGAIIQEVDKAPTISITELKPKARLLTPAEISALPESSVVWEEFYSAEKQRSTVLEPAIKIGGSLHLEQGQTMIDDSMDEPDVDGNQWRWWSAKPTDDQRGDEPWKNGSK